MATSGGSDHGAVTSGVPQRTDSQDGGAEGPFVTLSRHEISPKFLATRRKGGSIDLGPPSQSRHAAGATRLLGSR